MKLNGSAFLERDHCTLNSPSRSHTLPIIAADSNLRSTSEHPADNLLDIRGQVLRLTSPLRCRVSEPARPDDR